MTDGCDCPLKASPARLAAPVHLVPVKDRVNRIAFVIPSVFVVKRAAKASLRAARAMDRSLILPRDWSVRIHAYLLVHSVGESDNRIVPYLGESVKWSNPSTGGCLGANYLLLNTRQSRRSHRLRLGT